MPLDTAAVRWAGLPENRFTFLNRTLHLPAPDWNRRYESHLWNYQLHYFEFAVWCARVWVERGEPRYWQACRALIESWLAQARPGQSDGWDAYPTSLRIVNWIYAYCLLAEHEAGTEFQTRWRTSIYQQLDFLSRHLEHHLLANHLLKNAKALVLGGLFFAHDRQGQHWLETGQQLLWREFDEQVLPDGGHYERAPMYHAQTLGDWLECFALLQAFGSLAKDKAEIAQRLRAMAEFLEAASYTDNTLALFNDSANTAETRPQPLLATAARVCGYAAGSAPTAFPQTGYFVWQSSDAREKLIVDAGPPSVAYNTAHAHCDLLSYELRFDGKPFIVDTGVHGYGGDPFRAYCRATRAHNTVQFDQREQSELWGTFRLARRAEVLAAAAQGDATAWQFRGAYRPYYDRNLTHQRLIQRRGTGEWVVTDTAQGSVVHEAESFIHIHPAIQVRQGHADGFVIECQTDTRSILIEPFGDVTSVSLTRGSTIPATRRAQQQAQGWYFPTFGSAQPNPVICFRYRPPMGTAFGYRIRTVT
ncbi:MAG: alginate lyase family protein [Acidobacteria bacterium]|nr:alginate lyase family protein [Acidobacteriota bacterium]MBI3428046.1 alginate lyase family protein [Acidobacteriota bacterium]